MNQPKIVATVHHADSINSGLDIVKDGDPFYAWRVGEVTYYFKELENIVKICNRTLASIEKITREHACADVREIAHF